jgi:hypothetical protein
MPPKRKTTKSQKQVSFAIPTSIDGAISSVMKSNALGTIAGVSSLVVALLTIVLVGAPTLFMHFIDTTPQWTRVALFYLLNSVLKIVGSMEPPNEEDANNPLNAHIILSCAPVPANAPPKPLPQPVQWEKAEFNIILRVQLMRLALRFPGIIAGIIEHIKELTPPPMYKSGPLDPDYVMGENPETVRQYAKEFKAFPIDQDMLKKKIHELKPVLEHAYQLWRHAHCRSLEDFGSYAHRFKDINHILVICRREAHHQHEQQEEEMAAAEAETHHQHEQQEEEMAAAEAETHHHHHTNRMWIWKTHHHQCSFHRCPLMTLIFRKPGTKWSRKTSCGTSGEASDICAEPRFKQTRFKQPRLVVHEMRLRRWLLIIIMPLLHWRLSKRDSSLQRSEQRLQ